MSKKLVIVESPTKQKKIQEMLGKDYKVLASKGHITDLAKGGKNGIGIDIKKDFKPHYVLMEDKVETLQQLLNATKTADLIYLSSDPDREGEQISHQIYERLKDTNKPFKRAVFNEIKKDKVLKALSEAGDIDMNMVNSATSRRIIDRIVGFTASPFLMNYFGNNLSAGRVQSVVTRIIIDREREIEKFVPEDFWTIQVTLAKGKEAFNTKYSGQLRDLKTAEATKLRLNPSNAEYVVSEVISSEEKKYPQPPLVTATLQRLMSKKCGFSADRTMKASQELFEHGYISYHRTDSVRVSDDALKEVREWIKNNNYELPKKAYAYKNKDAAQDAHECIRPSDINLLPDTDELTDPDQKLVYEIIWKYFVASQMMPTIYNTLKITAHVKGDKGAEVKASGKALKSKGYLEILGIEDDSKIEIPNLSKGDLLKLAGKNPVKMDRKQTQPPPRYSEDKLIKELVDKSIGRPATYAELLNKLTSRNYVEKRGNVYHATDLGKKVTDILAQFFTFMDYDYTATMETQLDLIETGKLNHIEMLKKFYAPFKEELNKAYLAQGGSICDKCGSPMVTRTAKKTGAKFLSCSAYPNCKSTKSFTVAA